MKQLYINFQNRLLSVIILSGALNSFLNVYVYNFSFTFFVVLVVILDIFYNLLKREKIIIPKNYRIIFFLMVFFYILIVLSLFYSPSSSYKYIKTANFVVNCVFITYPLFVKKLDINKVFNLVKYTAIALSLFFLYQRYNYWFSSNVEDRKFYSKFFSLGVIYLSLGVMISISLIHESFKKNWIQVFALFFIILALGSRGSFLFSFITVLFFHYQNLLRINKKILNRKQIIISLGLSVTLASLIFKFRDIIFNIAAVGIDRFVSLINFSEDQSSLGRLNHYNCTIEMIFSAPIKTLFGHGIGSYGLLTEGLDVRKYPHNVFLESWFEIGVLGMLILITILISVFFLKSTLKTINAVYLFLFLNAMKTGNTTDLWILFLFMGLILSKQKNNTYFGVDVLNVLKKVLYIRNLS